MNPPFAIEQAVDLILALPAHRSSNANHVDFGKMLVDEYFVKLRDYYKSDPVAYAYLNELFAAIASAVRAFSVQRDIFQTQRTAKTNGRDAVIEKSKRIWSYSLLEDFRGQITTLFTGLTLTGLAAYLNAGYKSLLALPSVWLALIIWDIVLRKYANSHIQEAELLFPVDLQKQWMNDNTTKYQNILESFVKVAAEIQMRRYPDSFLWGHEAHLLKAESIAISAKLIAEQHRSF